MSRYSCKVVHVHRHNVWNAPYLHLKSQSNIPNTLVPESGWRVDGCCSDHQLQTRMTQSKKSVTGTPENSIENSKALLNDHSKGQRCFRTTQDPFARNVTNTCLVVWSCVAPKQSDAILQWSVGPFHEVPWCAGDRFLDICIEDIMSVCMRYFTLMAAHSCLHPPSPTHVYGWL